MKRNEEFLSKAEALKPKLHKTVRKMPGEDKALKDGGEAWFDFGDHYTGYLTIAIEPAGRHQDAPLHFAVDLYEHSAEFKEDPSRYRGWISPAWIQKEQLHVDVLPCEIRLPRRYAFRYVRIKILHVSGNYSVRIRRVMVEAVSSADDAVLKPFTGRSADRLLDKVSVRTLHECMQEVFEDGPKRDRRLWLGDLRLQALANTQTYRDYDLVKRCLYLFAGDTLENGAVASNLFLYPQVECDDQSMFDYALFFINTLWDYYDATGDEETLRELEPTARRQAELFREAFDGRHLMDMKKAGGCFVDWNLLLDKQASAQAIYIYAVKALICIERTLGKETNDLQAEVCYKTQAAKQFLFDKKRGLFVSGAFRQVSWASQVWMVLAGVVQGQEASKLLARMEKHPFAVKMKTPYMVHHYIQALLDCGEKNRAYVKMKAYWGGMLVQGADTFWEVFDPVHPKASPYGGRIIHSYCHAWSCTPAYFLRKYFSD